MPTYQIEEMATRIGLALAAGVLIGTVPIALRAARYQPNIVKRILLNLLSLVALVGFFFYSWYLWNRYVPREPEAPAPIVYPASPAVP
jgi:ABC-type uncharacterized transport system permease subunit